MLNDAELLEAASSSYVKGDLPGLRSFAQAVAQGVKGDLPVTLAQAIAKVHESGGVVLSRKHLPWVMSSIATKIRSLATYTRHPRLDGPGYVEPPGIETCKRIQALLEIMDLLYGKPFMAEFIEWRPGCRNCWSPGDPDPLDQEAIFHLHYPGRDYVVKELREEALRAYGSEMTGVRNPRST